MNDCGWSGRCLFEDRSFNGKPVMIVTAAAIRSYFASVKKRLQKQTKLRQLGIGLTLGKSPSLRIGCVLDVSSPVTTQAGLHNEEYLKSTLRPLNARFISSPRITVFKRQSVRDAKSFWLSKSCNYRAESQGTNANRSYVYSPSRLSVYRPLTPAGISQCRMPLANHRRACRWEAGIFLARYILFGNVARPTDTNQRLQTWCDINCS